ncbi:hypothetical protein [Aurantimonas marina]|uniref:hypothetical protein n=1 Tax=Aurantimonas marina TaxID=2780508 RepID=UPI0019D0F9C1|nr:hypothetical protein [Aurantimonas marina]
MVKLPSDRLLALLMLEIDVFEIAIKENKPAKETPAQAAVGRPKRAAGAGTDRTREFAAAKERIDLLVQMTRTLEKLLELRRLEVLAAQGGAEDEAETAQLREELLNRLRSLDARRRAGPALFDTATGAFAGDAAVLRRDVAAPTSETRDAGEQAGAVAETG